VSTSYLETVRAAYRTKLKTIKYATSTSTTMAQTANTITRETGSFITDGWSVGMTGKIADSGSNNGATFTVSGTVAALTLTVTETLIAQTKAQTVSCVLTSTFRNTVAEVYEDFQQTYGTYPSIVLKFGSAKLIPTDSAWKLYDIHIDFGIFCQISADTGLAATSSLVAAQDSLVHDVMRCLAELYTENIVASSGARWHILNEPPVTLMPILPTGDNTGEFGIYGTLKIRNLNKSFDS
jgi:hypothetical protein